MSNGARILLIVTGAVIFSSWGFRLSVLFRHRGDDPFALIHLASLLVSVMIGAFLFRVGLRGDGATRRDYIGVMASALFTTLFWGYRWVGLIGQPSADTRERAHLHLSSLFLILGALLFAIGWRGRARTPARARP